MNENTSSSPALSISDIYISYHSNHVISGVNLEVPAGETFGLIGLNGSGKTTLIKAVIGLRDQNSGGISIFGDEHAHKESKKKLAYLPERFEPPWFLKGNEFIRFSLSLYGQRYDQKIVENAARSLALDPDVLDKKVQTYSKGMRQKLGLLATFLSECQLLILDEPMSGLDPQARACVKTFIKDIQKSGRTVFLSSHILSDMKDLCDKVAVLYQKKIRFSGTPESLCKQYSQESLEQAFLKIIEDESRQAA